MNQKATSMPIVSLLMRLRSGARQSSNAGSHSRSDADDDDAIAVTARTAAMAQVARLMRRDCAMRMPEPTGARTRKVQCFQPWRRDRDKESLSATRKRKNERLGIAFGRLYRSVGDALCKDGLRPKRFKTDSVRAFDAA